MALKFVIVPKSESLNVRSKQSESAYEAKLNSVKSANEANYIKLKRDSLFIFQEEGRSKKFTFTYSVLAYIK